MPDLLTDEAYSGAIQLQDKEDAGLSGSGVSRKSAVSRMYFIAGQTKRCLPR